MSTEGQPEVTKRYTDVYRRGPARGDEKIYRCLWERASPRWPDDDGQTSQALQLPLFINATSLFTLTFNINPLCLVNVSSSFYFNFDSQKKSIQQRWTIEGDQAETGRTLKRKEEQ